MCSPIVEVVLAFLLVTSPITIYWLSRIPWGLKYSKWRVVQRKEEYWVEYKNILGMWTSYLTWENIGLGVPYFHTMEEAQKFISEMKEKTFAKVVYTNLDD